jgi:transposase
MTIATENLPDEIQALKQIIADLARDAVAAQAEIAKLKFQLARYRRAEFGRSSEKLARDLAQLELAIEAVETDQAERLAASPPAVAAVIEAAVEAQKPARRPLPEQLPREDVVHSAPCTCPSCGGALRKIGEDKTEIPDYVPGRFKVVRHVRDKLACRACDTVVQAPAPYHPIARGRAGAGLLAHIVVSKYDDHLPLYRQAEIYTREGVELETSTLSGWVGATTAALTPLSEVLVAEVMASETLYGDDTPLPVLAPGSGKTKTGRIWTYVRDERPIIEDSRAQQSARLCVDHLQARCRQLRRQAAHVIQPFAERHPWGAVRAFGTVRNPLGFDVPKPSCEVPVSGICGERGVQQHFTLDRHRTQCRCQQPKRRNALAQQDRSQELGLDRPPRWFDISPGCLIERPRLPAHARRSRIVTEPALPSLRCCACAQIS